VAHPRYQENKVRVALFSGFIVFLVGAVADVAVVPWERTLLVQQLIGDLIAALVATLLSLSIQLKYEEMHYRFAMERAAIVAELNHHVRNAVFPLCLAVQRTGDAESVRVSNDAVERINIALKDAAADAFARKVEYTESKVVTLGPERAA
jgi:hypothetical protein